MWLRGFEDEDLEAYRSFTQSGRGHEAGYTVPSGTPRIKAWFDKVRVEHGKDAFYFVVSPIDADDFLGTAWLWNFGQRIGGAEFSIFIADPGRWGSGIGTDATNALLDFAFGYNDLHRVWLYTHVENERAQRSFAKAGFVKEGVLRQHYMGDGKLRDSVLMAILRPEWEALDRPRSWELRDGAGD